MPHDDAAAVWGGCAPASSSTTDLVVEWGAVAETGAGCADVAKSPLWAWGNHCALQRATERAGPL